MQQKIRVPFRALFIEVLYDIGDLNREILLQRTTRMLRGSLGGCGGFIDLVPACMVCDMHVALGKHPTAIIIVQSDRVAASFQDGRVNNQTETNCKPNYTTRRATPGEQKHRTLNP